MSDDFRLVNCNKTTLLQSTAKSIEKVLRLSLLIIDEETASALKFKRWLESRWSRLYKV